MTIDAMARIHPTAVIEDGAEIAAGVSIGPFSVIGAKVSLAEGVEIKSHVVVTGNTSIGPDTVIFSFSVVGEIPQDLKYHGEDTRLEIGARNRIREHVTINPGTEGGGGITSIGDDCLLMAGVHVAHDCRVGNRVILVNNVGLAGHVQVDDDVIIGGISGVHQWVRIGKGAIIGGLSKVEKDVIPYGMVQGKAGSLVGLNLIGLKRRGLDRTDINALREAYVRLANEGGTFRERAEALSQEAANEYVSAIAAFILSDSDRSFLTPE